MQGQWFGVNEGENAGEIVVEVDAVDNRFIGYAYLYPKDQALPPTFAGFVVPMGPSPVAFTANIAPLHPQTHEHTTWQAVQSLYPDVQFGSSVNAEIVWDAEHMAIKWSTDIGTIGQAKLSISKADKPSALVAQRMSWQDFKRHLETIEYRRFVFRGQKEPRRLRTAFHRTGRTNMFRFRAEDIQALHRAMSGRTKHFFQINDPDQLGAFCSLAQHHGYPTPLLDWSYSPFVSAYFAYHRVTKPDIEATPDGVVRIFKFDRKLWEANNDVFLRLTQGRRHFSFLDTLAIDNERMAPQQGVSSITNMDDIEWYIAHMEKLQEQRYLEAIDLPLDERPRVMQELSVMGITAGALFPGLDGICEELKERLFNV